MIIWGTKCNGWLGFIQGEAALLELLSVSGGNWHFLLKYSVVASYLPCFLQSVYAGLSRAHE